MRKAVTWLAVAGLISSVPGLAADSQLEAGRQCAQVRDSLQRLVCYDRVFQGGDSSPSPVVQAPRPSLPAPMPAPAPAAAPAPASVPVPAPAAAAPAIAAPALGDESVQRRAKAREEKPAEPSTLDATVSALKETRPGVVRLSLDNGQVWQQMDMSTVFQVAVGDTVRIEKGTMGGFRLSRTSRGRSGWVRVTRVQ